MIEPQIFDAKPIYLKPGRLSVDSVSINVYLATDKPD
jgi:hypothetical protein